MSDRFDLEVKFMLGLFAVLATGGVAYAALDAQGSGLFVGIAFIVAVGVVASGAVHYGLFKPIRRLVAMAKAVGSGDFSKRLCLERNDEIGSLAFEMDTMCDQLEAAKLASEAHIAALEQLRHSDRIATLGRLASSVAHELGNPLNVIELRAQLITSGDAATLDQAQQSASVIVEQTRRMTRIIDEILSFARMQPARIARLNLGAVLRKAIALSEHTSKKYGTHILFATPQTVLEIDGDADKLLQLLVNLMINGVQAMPVGGTLELSMSHEHRTPIDDPEGVPRTYAFVDVADHGIGMPPHLLSKVFEPFFSTRSTEGGTGLGLSVAQGIAHEHEGWISATSAMGQGSTFRVYLPKDGLIAAG